METERGMRKVRAQAESKSLDPKAERSRRSRVAVGLVEAHAGGRARESYDDDGARRGYLIQSIVWQDGAHEGKAHMPRLCTLVGAVVGRWW